MAVVEARQPETEFCPGRYRHGARLPGERRDMGQGPGERRVGGQGRQGMRGHGADARFGDVPLLRQRHLAVPFWRTSRVDVRGVQASRASERPPVHGRGQFSDARREAVDHICHIVSLPRSPESQISADPQHHGPDARFRGRVDGQGDFQERDHRRVRRGLRVPGTSRVRPRPHPDQANGFRTVGRSGEVPKDDPRRFRLVHSWRCR